MDVSVLSIVVGATDANPVNKVVQPLSGLETKIQEGVEAKRLHESSLVGVCRKRVISLLQCREREERSSGFGSAARAARCHERGEVSGPSCMKMFGLEQMKIKFREEL